ncbi:anchored repeat-type ABC transporter ATP-binding subunit [Blastococcus haudaquaticus]|uniref:Manganese/iron transport system ATP-binding protein n=1 Tax=Blastococcus haudaquaticus TaxID=1938745 RepID=A0A286H360_9ACTN|nr:anchored repeat-type ABC transporter ATP-binding subunit [Blastococcus haudaquaticus]SOE02233.1 manganese/iron transport system ATP-binding protein [Blastococcus haudaquaticus]
MTVLQVEDVSVALGGRTVLRDVDLSVEAGEFVGLIGPNGAGKTTLLRTVLALVRPSAGSVLVQGRRARPGAPGVGYVPQRHEFAWDFPISIEQTVMTGLVGRQGLFRRPSASDWRLVADALDRVGMAHLRTRPVGELSGGQRQRVLVARALALHPSVLLLDEPFTGLDMPTQELLSDLFTRLAGEGTAVLMTTHDLLEALARCGRLVLLNRTVVADAPPDRLRDPELWVRTFGLSERSPLLAFLTAA